MPGTGLVPRTKRPTLSSVQISSGPATRSPILHRRMLDCRELRSPIVSVVRAVHRKNDALSRQNPAWDAQESRTIGAANLLAHPPADNVFEVDLVELASC